MVAWQREALFGEIVNGEIELNRYGQIVLNAWFDLPRHYRYVELRAVVVMPNHVHGIVIFDGNGRGGSVGNYSEPDKIIAGKSLVPEVTQTRPYVTTKRHDLPEIVRAFKSFSARRINIMRHTEGVPVWQRNYYEHIIRNEGEIDKITRYIESNPFMWAEDNENPLKPKGRVFHFGQSDFA
jgi:REP element-mobilizing transposase RayT